MTTTESNRTTREEWEDFARTGPGTLAGRYMRMYWQPIYRSEDLPAGRAKPVRVMSEDFTLYRGAGGQAHLVDFRCAHRGTQLSAGWVEDDNIRCFYHGWKYAGSGQCIEQPGEKEKQFAAKVKIRSFPVEEYLGLIFVFLGEGEAPPLPRFPDWERVGVAKVLKLTRHCNYWNYMENHPDPVHTPFVHHTRYYGTWNMEDMPEISTEEMEWGSANRVTYMPIEGTDEKGWTRLTAMGMPNVHEKRSGNPHRTAVGSGVTAEEAGESPDENKLSVVCWNVPIDDEWSLEFSINPVNERMARRMARTAILDTGEKVDKANMRATELIHEVLAGKLTIEEAEAIALEDPLGNPFAGEGLRGLQDGLAQVGQGYIAPRDVDHLGTSDEGIIMLRKLWRQELRKVAEGEPLTEWYRPEWFYGSY